MLEISPASIAIALSNWRDDRIDHLFCLMSVGKDLRTGYVYGGSPIQKTLDTEIVKNSLASVLSQPTSFKLQISSISPMFVEDGIVKKLLFLVRSHISEMRIGFAVGHYLTASGVSTSKHRLLRVQIALPPYILYNSIKVLYEVAKVVSTGTHPNPSGLGFFPRILQSI